MRCLAVILLGAIVANANAQREIRSVQLGTEEVKISNRLSAKFVPPVRKADPNFEIQATKEKHLPGRKIRVHQISPPDRRPVPPETKATPEVLLTPKEIARLEAEYQVETFASLSATVVDRKATFLRWSYGKEDFYAWSSIDFNFVRGLGRFELDGKPYSLFMGIGDIEAERLEDWVGLPPKFTGSAPQFQVVSDNNPSPEALEVIEAIHKMYASKEQELKLAYKEREKANRERKAWLKRNPKPTDRNFYLWQGESGGVLEGPPPDGGYVGDALRFQEAQKRKKKATKSTRQKPQSRRASR